MAKEDPGEQAREVLSTSLNRTDARALVEAGYMPLREYIRLFGDTDCGSNSSKPPCTLVRSKIPETIVERSSQGGSK
ncbi:hypothetical protein [Bradyrhizobium sp. RDM4]|uniref:hypothetical protein n=1 Tax=Bradyrhizobium sp. RDM4 TaxID=3378765 RepID=UPI0038FC4D96